MPKFSFSKFALTSTLAVLTTGCAAFFPAPTALIPGAENVVVDPAPAGRGCKFLGNISADALNGSPYVSGAQLNQNVINSLKNKAFSLGGNYVDTTKEAEDFDEVAPGVTVPEERFIAGKAYNCSYSAKTRAKKAKRKNH